PSTPPTSIPSSLHSSNFHPFIPPLLQLPSLHPSIPPLPHTQPYRHISRSVLPEAFADRCGSIELKRQNLSGVRRRHLHDNALPGCTPSLQAPQSPGGVTFGTEWFSLLRPSTVNGTLKFSRSLNDVGQRMDSLCSGLHFIDRTCSEGELEVKPEPPNTDRKSKALNGKAATLPHQASNLPSSNLLRLFLPFSRSSTSASLQCSELGSYDSRLHIAKSSSALMGGSEPPLGGAEDLLGDDEVFEIPKGRTGAGIPGRDAGGGVVALLGEAPLCYMDEDSDLDQFSFLDQWPLTPGPLSPYSLSGDCCRWVIPGLSPCAVLW
ncbi:unnamed protein product, partial [Oncorhynchus mykiss]